ncbi:MAG: hypothetical protein JMDDDDMK_04290 [Acidobacteria bacterium]|nr:hypothetical protein [Acidobacteriota bacterium]
MAANDYRLSPASSYRKAGTDRLDIGCNIESLFKVNLEASAKLNTKPGN